MTITELATVGEFKWNTNFIRDFWGDQHLLKRSIATDSNRKKFGIYRVMSGFIANLLFCLQQWFGKHNSDFWNLVQSFFMWIIWTECNRHSFKDTKKSLTQLIDLCQQTLLDWSWCWAFSNCFSLTKFLVSQHSFSIPIFLCLLFCSSLFIIVNTVYSFTFCFFLFFLIILHFYLGKKIRKFNEILLHSITKNIIISLIFVSTLSTTW